MATRKSIRETVERLQRAHYDVAVDWAYGQPRISTLDEARYLSPRLPAGKLATWLDGFEAGSEAEQHRQRVLAAIDGN